MKRNQCRLICGLVLGFLLVHILSLKFLRLWLGWKELFLLSYIFIGLLYYLFTKKRITQVQFILLTTVPFLTWTFTHVLNLIRYTDEGWVSIIFSIYFFVPYVVIAGMLLWLVLRKKSSTK